MPTLDYAIIGDYVRADAGVVSIIGGGFDTIWAARVPTVRPLGLAARLLFEDDEIGQTYVFSMVLESAAGDEIFEASSRIGVPERAGPDELPSSLLMATNFRIGLPDFGHLRIKLSVGDEILKTIPLIVLKGPPKGS